jgi:hypothetical protein
MPEYCGHSYESVAIALSARCARDDPSVWLSPELVSGVEIRRAPPRLSDLPVAKVKHPDVLAVVVVITALRGHVRQRDGMIVTGGYIMELLSERSH